MNQAWLSKQSLMLSSKSWPKKQQILTKSEISKITQGFANIIPRPYILCASTMTLINQPGYKTQNMLRFWISIASLKICLLCLFCLVRTLFRKELTFGWWISWQADVTGQLMHNIRSLPTPLSLFDVFVNIYDSEWRKMEMEMHKFPLDRPMHIHSIQQWKYYKSKDFPGMTVECVS